MYIYNYTLRLTELHIHAYTSVYVQVKQSLYSLTEFINSVKKTTSTRTYVHIHTYIHIQTFILPYTFDLTKGHEGYLTYRIVLQR